VAPPRGRLGPSLALADGTLAGGGGGVVRFRLYKIFFPSEVFVHESILFYANTPFVWALHATPLSLTLLRNR